MADWMREMTQRLAEYNKNTQNPADLESTEWLTKDLAPEIKLQVEDAIRKYNSGALGFFDMEGIMRQLPEEIWPVMDVYMRETGRPFGQDKLNPPGLPLTN